MLRRTCGGMDCCASAFDLPRSCRLLCYLIPRATAAARLRACEQVGGRSLGVGR